MTRGQEDKWPTHEIQKARERTERQERRKEDGGGWGVGGVGVGVCVWGGGGEKVIMTTGWRWR